MIQSTVKFFDGFGSIMEDLDRLAVNALDAAAVAAADAARAAGAVNHAGDIEVVRAEGDIDGFQSGIRGRWYYRFLSYGTLGNALRVKRPGTKRSRAAGTGTRPNFMWQNARAAGRRALIGRLSRGL